MSRRDTEAQRREFAAIDMCERNFERLSFELSVGAPRRYLDVLVELLHWVVDRDLQPTALRDRYRERLARMERIIAGRHNLRLAKCPLIAPAEETNDVA